MRYLFLFSKFNMANHVGYEVSCSNLHSVLHYLYFCDQILFHFFVSPWINLHHSFAPKVTLKSSRSLKPRPPYAFVRQILCQVTRSNFFFKCSTMLPELCKDNCQISIYYFGSGKNKKYHRLSHSGSLVLSSIIYLGHWYINISRRQFKED